MSMVKRHWAFWRSQFGTLRLLTLPSYRGEKQQLPVVAPLSLTVHQAVCTITVSAVRIPRGGGQSIHFWRDGNHAILRIGTGHGDLLRRRHHRAVARW